MNHLFAGKVQTTKPIEANEANGFNRMIEHEPATFAKHRAHACEECLSQIDSKIEVDSPLFFYVFFSVQ